MCTAVNGCVLTCFSLEPRRPALEGNAGRVLSRLHTPHREPLTARAAENRLLSDKAASIHTLCGKWRGAHPRVSSEGVRVTSVRGWTHNEPGEGVGVPSLGRVSARRSNGLFLVQTEALLLEHFSSRSCHGGVQEGLQEKPNGSSQPFSSFCLFPTAWLWLTPSWGFPVCASLGGVGVIDKLRTSSKIYAAEVPASSLPFLSFNLAEWVASSRDQFVRWRWIVCHCRSSL